MASPAQLNVWVGRESAGAPVHIAQPDIDLADELRRELSYVRRTAKSRRHGR